MAKTTATEYVNKHAQRLTAASEDIRRGIAKVKESPPVAAANKLPKMKARLDEAFATGKVERGLRSVTLAEWQKQTADKGIGRIAQGVESAKAKNTVIAARLLDAVDAAAAKANSLPDVTFEDAINRMTTFVREMHGAKIK